jgi:hypothetical protein
MSRVLTADLRRVAEQQAGMLSRAQVLSAGLTDEFIRAQRDAGRWRWIHPGVCATSNAELTRAGEIWAALLYAGCGAIASHETAAELWGLTNGPATPGTPISVTVPAHRMVAARAGIRVFRSRRVEQIRHPAKLPPVSRVEETVLDLSDQATSLSAVLTWVTRACQRRQTQPHRLAEALARRHRVRWRRELNELLADVAEGAETPLEIRYLRTVERNHRLPAGERQRHRHADGQSQWIDVHYRDYRLIVELDGRIGHEEDGRFRDHRRDNYSTVQEACDTLRYGWTDVANRPCELAGEVAGVLRRNGWPGDHPICSAHDNV